MIKIELNSLLFNIVFELNQYNVSWDIFTLNSADVNDDNNILLNNQSCVYWSFSPQALVGLAINIDNIGHE